MNPPKTRSCNGCDVTVPNTPTDKRRHQRTGLCNDCLTAKRDGTTAAFGEDLGQLLALRLGWGEVTRRMGAPTPAALYRKAIRYGHRRLAADFAAIHECAGLSLPCPFGFTHEGTTT